VAILVNMQLGKTRSSWDFICCMLDFNLMAIFGMLWVHHWNAWLRALHGYCAWTMRLLL
jgi:hypothetical protein